jgi:citronellol/citronellal dehydrogenase
MSLKYKSVLITGASRGVGRAIALACARKGANIGLLARSHDNPFHRKLSGTLNDVKKEIREIGKPFGSTSIAIKCDLLNPYEITMAVKKMRSFFGDIDVVVNNASALSINKVEKFEANANVLGTNVIGTANIIGACYPYLKQSTVGHILSISPPVQTLSKKWMYPHPMYTASKYGMSIVTLGFSDELRANTLWPRKLLRTAATKLIEKKTGLPAYSQGLDPKHFASVAVGILESNSTGMSLLDSDIERLGEGVDDIFI